MNCYNDWADHFMERAIDQVSGRITEPYTLTEENAWNKRRHWYYESGNTGYRYLSHNMVSGQHIEISEQDFKTQTEPPL